MEKPASCFSFTQSGSTLASLRASEHWKKKNRHAASTAYTQTVCVNLYQPTYKKVLDKT